MGRHNFKKGLVSGACAVCGEKFKGLIKRGMVCSGCKTAVHENCVAMSLDSCPVASSADPLDRFGLSDAELGATAASKPKPKTPTPPAASAAKTKQKAKTPDADVLAGLGLSAADLGEGDDDDGMGEEGDGGGMGDGDDADLAAQLTVQKPKTKAKPSGGGDVDVDGVLADTAGDGDAEGVEANDDDMNDPSLLGELGDLGVPIPEDEPEPAPVPAPVPVPARKTPSPTAAVAVAVATKAKDPKEEIQIQMEEEKRLYEKLKADGDMQGAIAHGKNVIALKKKLQELETAAAAPAPTRKTPSPTPPQQQAEEDSATTQPPAKKASPPAVVRQQQPETAAAPAPARKPPSPTPGRRAPSPTTTRRAAQPAPAPAPQEDPQVAAEKRRIAMFDELEKNLAAQVKELQTKAVRAKQAQDMQTAKALLLQSKDVAAQLAHVQQMKADPARPPVPEVVHETVERKIERTFADVMPNEISVIIARAEGLVVPEYPQLSTYVYCEAQFSESGPVTKLQSPIVANSSNPVYNFAGKLPIERNKTLARFFEKKKLIFSIWHRRGLVMKDLQIGRFEVAFVDLLHKAESVQHCPVLKPESKRPIADGAAVEVTLRLRAPLLGKDEITVTEDKISIRISSTPAPVPAPAPKPVAAPHSTTTATTTAKPVTAQPTAATASQAAAATTTPPTKPVPRPVATQQVAAAASSTGADGEMTEQEKLLEEANNLDRLVSNDVLEWEKARVIKLIASLKAAKKEVPDDLTDRLQMIDVKLQMLVLSVQTGKLTQEAYLEMVQKAAAKEKQLALKLNAAGLKEEAKLALQRFKVLEAEIASATAEGGDE